MTNPRLMRLFVPLAICFVLAGCGQKGPLYLPEQTQQPGEQTENAGQ